MNVMQHVRQLEKLGFDREILDRAVALAGSDRLVYSALCQAVEQANMTPTMAVAEVEKALSAKRR